VHSSEDINEVERIRLQVRALELRDQAEIREEQARLREQNRNGEMWLNFFGQALQTVGQVLSTWFANRPTSYDRRGRSVVNYPVRSSPRLASISGVSTLPHSTAIPGLPWDHPYNMGTWLDGLFRSK